MHLESSRVVPRKQSDYFSCTPQLIFDKFVSKKDAKRDIPKGYYGLPTAEEVGQDLMTNMVSPGGPILSMEISQYIFSEAFKP